MGNSVGVSKTFWSACSTSHFRQLQFCIPKSNNRSARGNINIQFACSKPVYLVSAVTQVAGTKSITRHRSHATGPVREVLLDFIADPYGSIYVWATHVPGIT